MIYKQSAHPFSPPRMSLALASALLALPALAQDAAPIARVEITGSNIRRAQAETASAVQTLNAAGSAVNGNVRYPDTLDYYNRGNLAGAGLTRTTTRSTTRARRAALSVRG